MPFTGDTFAHLFDWVLEPKRQEKIRNASLEAEFDGIDTGLSAVAARVTAVEGGAVADNSISNAELADMAAYTLKGRNAGTSGDPSDIDVSALTAKTGLTANDLLLLIDSAASNAFKKVLYSTIRPRAVIFGSCKDDTVAGGATGYLGALLDNTEANVNIPIAVAGTFRNLRVVGNNPAAAVTVTSTVRKNSAATAVTCSWGNGQNTGSDTTNSVAFAAGDLFALEMVNPATGAAQSPRYSIEFYPDT
jgi:hypothetical protein